MSKAISLSRLIDEAIYLEDPSTKNLAGSITDARDFHDHRQSLQAFHRGLFSFLAFHPRTDAPVAEYVETGSLASDSGPKILVLFFAAKDIRFPRAVTPKDLNLGVELDLNAHPAYEFVEWLLPGQSLPQFPGIMFMDNVVESIDAVYVPIANHSNAIDVADCCRSIFALANHIQTKNPNEPFSMDSFCAALKSANIDYTRSGGASISEWLVVAYQFGKKHQASIVSVIAKAVTLS
jgi:hypothetical protein